MKKLTRGQSCLLCQQRKVRCDQQKPCTNCVRVQVECTVMPLLPPKPRQKKKQSQSLDSALMDRLHRCETLLAQRGVDVDKELSAPTSPRPSRDPASAIAAPDGASTPRVKWFAYTKEYQATDELLRGSSDNEADQPAIHHDFDAMFDNSDGFPFVVGGGIENISSLHPPVIEILQLWQVYIQRVDPLLKVTHLPTLQAQIVSAGANPTAISKPLEALMFAIYLIALHSMADNEVHDMFHEAKPRLLARYHHATQQALINAAFMRTTELTLLQAYLLYLFSISRSVDPRSLFCLVGIAMRIGTRLGLHRDCARFGMSPFETELRRRLWWQIVIFDKRLAEMTGSPITALTSSPNDCCLPLNVNDPDLHPSAKDPPIPAVGASEMLFSLTRIELTIAPTTMTPGGRDSRFRPGPSNAVNHQSSMSPFSQSSEGDESRGRDCTAHHSPEDLDAYGAHLDAVYLQHCDPRIPVQHFTLLMARGALCKQRIFSFMCRGVPSSTLSPHERDNLFLAAIQMVEYDTLIYATDNLRGFRWYADLHVPMLGSLFLASELRLRPRGELNDRAWKAIFENQEHRSGNRNSNGRESPAEKGPSSPIHAAFEHMLLKAWEAYEQADLQSGRCTSQRQPPLLITRIRESRGNPTTEAVPESPGEDSQMENEANSNDDLLMMGPDAMTAAQLTPSSPSIFDGMDQVYGASLYGYNQLDWTYLVQSGALQGFVDGPNGVYMG